MAELTLPTARQVWRASLAWPIEAGALALVLLIALSLRVLNLDAYTGSFDEGIRSQQLLLMEAGYRPFREIFSSQGLLLLDLLYPFYLAFGQTLEAVRAGVVFFSIVGIVGAWWVGRLIAGPLAGLAAAAILGLSPGYLEGSRLALAEVPTIAPGLLALGAALTYRESRRRPWLLLSACLCALALLIKPMVVHAIIPIGLVLVAPLGPPTYRTARGWASALRGGLFDLLIFGLVAGLICSVAIVALGPVQVWENLGAYRAGAGHSLGSDWPQNLRLTATVMARERIGVFLLAFSGAVAGLWIRPVPTVSLIVWTAAIFSMFLLYGDLSDKHIVYLIPPVAVLAGVGVGIAARALGVVAGNLQRRVKEEQHTPYLVPLVALAGLLALAFYLVDTVPLYRANQYLIWDAEMVAERRRDRGAELEMAEIMRTRAEPSDWVLSDNPGAAFQAGRKVIPALVDTSGTRVDAGSLTSAGAIDAVKSYQPAVIVTWARRLGRLDGLTDWLPTGGYRLERTYDNGWKLYVRESTGGR